MSKPDEKPDEDEESLRLGKIRSEIVRLAQIKRSRERDYPNKWHPNSVLSPLGLPFTQASAWEFVADSFEEFEFSESLQDDPPGAIAYQMVVCLEDEQEIFIKVRLGKAGNKILGRSFHYSEGLKYQDKNESID